MSEQSSQEAITRLLKIMQRLRDPESGCPWDRVQTFETIAPYTIEEAYEVADAIARHDMRDLCDELGDLLLQVVYHAQMAAENKQFEFTEVVNSICEKMVRRHPHVFQPQKESHVQNLQHDWERIKTEERAARSGGLEDHSILADVSNGLPPLLRARKLQKKAARVHFDWPDAEQVIKKISEELDELAQALRDNEPGQRIEEEIGDLLFSVVNISRHLQVDPELALLKSNSKFETRFRAMEVLASRQGQKITELSENELDQLWEQVKKDLSNKI